MLREKAEDLEKRFLSSYAMLSCNSKGRKNDEKKCEIRTDFQRDRDRILHSKAFRRLKHKTQVFITPEGDHFRTRLTHTLEVSQVARTIARALRLNEDLAEAIALGHDLGHTPFGHTGEEVLNDLLAKGFKHEKQSLRIVDILENGTGLNLTWEVRDGILNHTNQGTPSTLEGEVVKVSDWIAYINHDIDDAIRAGILSYNELPKDSLSVLGKEHGERIDSMIRDVIENSKDIPKILMSKTVKNATVVLRNFLFKKVYVGSKAKEQEGKAKVMLRLLFNYFINNPEQMPLEFLNIAKKDGIPRAVCDYIAGMTDSFALYTFKNIFIPSQWSTNI